MYFFKGILKRIETSTHYNDDRFVSFTLEEFLEKYPFEKYPYKVGDKVVSSHNKELIGTIVDINWKNDILYTVKWCNDITNNIASYYCYDLQPYKEEIYTDVSIDEDSKTDIIIDGEKLIVPKGYTVKNATTNGNSLIVEYIKNKPQYPNTYEECCQITKKVAKTTHELDIAYNPNLIYDFQKLLICRDAYWKIAGDWEEKRKKEINHYVIYSTLNGGLVKDCLSCTMVKHLLDFPTKEMRDAFYENFKDLIEQCKEFL